MKHRWVTSSVAARATLAKGASRLLAKAILGKVTPAKVIRGRGIRVREIRDREIPVREIPVKGILANKSPVKQGLTRIDLIKAASVIAEV